MAGEPIRQARTRLLPAHRQSQDERVLPDGAIYPRYYRLFPFVRIAPVGTGFSRSCGLPPVGTGFSRSCGMLPLVRVFPVRGELVEPQWLVIWMGPKCPAKVALACGPRRGFSARAKGTAQPNRDLVSLGKSCAVCSLRGKPLMLPGRCQYRWSGRRPRIQPRPGSPAISRFRKQ